jgi:hypothetical protein
MSRKITIRITDFMSAKEADASIAVPDGQKIPRKLIASVAKLVNDELNIKLRENIEMIGKDNDELDFLNWAVNSGKVKVYCNNITPEQLIQEYKNHITKP